MLAQADVKGAIKADMMAAKQEAAELLRRAEEERREILTEGKRQAALAREEAATRGASAAFARAAEEALFAFRKRADRYAEAADDIRTLALEIVKKLLGADADLSAKDVERILSAGLLSLRAKRKVRVQVSAGRRKDLSFERPNLMKAVDNSPDLLVEDADDVREGFARVVTEVGGALCAEESALDAVALAVNVKETPRARGSNKTGATQVGSGSTGEASRDRGRTGRISMPDDDDSSELDARDAHDDVDDADDVDDLPAAAVEEDSDESIPDAGVVEDDDEDVDSTRALPARIGRPRQNVLSSSEAPTERPRAQPLPPLPVAPRPSRVEVRGGAATRVVAVDEPRRPQPSTADAADVDDDMDLFTDARPARRK